MTVTGYLRHNGNDLVFLQREKALLVAGCDAMIVERVTSIQQSTPLLDDYLANVKEGDELLTCGVHTLSRDVSVVSKTLAALKKAKAAIRFLDEDVDFNTPEREFAITLQAVRAEYEDKLTNEQLQDCLFNGYPDRVEEESNTV